MVTRTDKEAPLKDNAPDGVALSDAERAKALHEGAKESVKESGKDMHRFLTDGVEVGEPPVFQYHGMDEIQQYADIIDLPLSEFEAVIAGTSDRKVPDEKVAGLFALERNGKNRTPHVKALMARLGIKDVSEIPQAGGPDYTNDVSSITKL